MQYFEHDDLRAVVEPSVFPDREWTLIVWIDGCLQVCEHIAFDAPADQVDMFAYDYLETRGTELRAELVERRASVRGYYARAC